MTSKSRQSKKSSKSSKSKDKEKKDEEKKKEEEDAKSRKSEGAKTDRDSTKGEATSAYNSFNPSVEPNIKEKGWWTKSNVQNFIHHYIGERLTVEKMQLIVGPAYQKFLEGLEKPMKVNEMRNMKEPKYSKLRETIRNPKNYGDPVMKFFAENCESLGVSLNTFHMVIEGFWDLYCKKPATPDLTAKKLEGWINNINIRISPPGPDDVEEGEEAKAEEVSSLPVKAVARVRVPFKRPEAEGEEELDENGDPKPKTDSAS